MSKQFWGVIIGVVLIFVGFFALTNKSDNTTGKSSDKGSLSQHVIGENKAKVTLVEYGDFQCPYCGLYYPTLKQVEEQYKDQIQFQFRNYPLVSLHQNAFAAARAAEAASLQNKFWEMHDILYQTQDVWKNASDPSTTFKQYAAQIGLDKTKFEKDYISSAVNNTINADLAEGNKLGIEGTPAFFLDGKQIQINNSVASFQKVIDEAIAKKAPKDAGTTSQTTKSSDTTTPAATTEQTTSGN